MLPLLNGWKGRMKAGDRRRRVEWRGEKEWDTQSKRVSRAGAPASRMWRLGRRRVMCEIDR